MFYLYSLLSLNLNHHYLNPNFLLTVLFIKYLKIKFYFKNNLVYSILMLSNFYCNLIFTNSNQFN
jgi:hypothetical protein